MGLPAVSLGQLAFFCLTAAAFIVWQSAVVPRFTTKSHYHVLGLEPKSTVEDIQHAYDGLISLRSIKDGVHEEMTAELLQIQHAYEILSHPIRRRDYDHFHQDEFQDIVKNLTKHAGNAPFKLQLPLWEPLTYEPSHLETYSLNMENFETFMEGKEALLVQVYSVASRSCMEHEASWRRIYERMDGVARVGRLELGETKLAAYFADKNQASGSLSFRHGLPAYIAYPPNCRSQNCMIRFQDERSVDRVVDWFATEILRLPSILYYSPQTLVKQFFLTSGPQKVKVLLFSRTGERAAPFLRKAAKDVWEYAAFALVLWREEDSTMWQNMLGLEMAPALVFVKDPGMAPAIYYGSHNSSTFQKLVEEHKTHALPQLRSITADKLGCSEAGYSLAGNNTHTWYCVIVAGRPSFELSQARAVLRAVKENLTKEVSDVIFPQFLIVASAFKEKRLTFAWLDGLAQKKACYFYLSSERVHDVCGPKSYPEQSDVPQVFIIRYRRHPKDLEKFAKERTHFNSMWQKFLEEEENLASQIVAKYNGSLEASEIISWISAMVKEGDAEDLLFYVKRAPALVPEESRSAWMVDARDYVLTKREGAMRKCKSLLVGSLDYVKEPRFTPTFIVLVILYIGGLVLKPKINRH